MPANGASTAKNAPQVPLGMNSFVTAQHFHDGMRAGIEGVARTTATHLGQLERRIAAVEEQARPHDDGHGPTASRITSMTGFTNFIRGHR